MEKSQPGKISIVSQDITEIPNDLSRKYGSETKELAITFCRLTHISNLEDFGNTLVSLVLDNNEIGSDMNVFPQLPHLETLWVNNNNVSILIEFNVDNLRKWFFQRWIFMITKYVFQFRSFFS